MSKAIQQLNFDQIIGSIREKYQFSLSREFEDEFLRIAVTYQDVEQLQAYTKAFYKDYTVMGLPDLLPLGIFSTIIQKSEKQIRLDIEEFLQIKSMLVNIRRLTHFYEKHENELFEKQLIDEIILIMDDLPSIVKEIEKVMDVNGHIHDKASQKLFSIRNDQKVIEQRIRQTLNDLMQKEKSKMSENYYTIRNDRYVLPIKEEYKNTFKGILHDESQSQTTFYIEPQAIVVLNNKLQNLVIDEKNEIDRILISLSQIVFQEIDIIDINRRLLAKYDIYTAKMLFSFERNYVPVVTINNQDIQLFGAKHPLLDEKKVIGNDIILKKPKDLLAITGANTGGKSVFLKTVGFQVLMHQLGLFLPVKQDMDNRIGVFSNVFMDIGDEQSIEQNLSTFSAHITNIRNIISMASATDIILLDELGSGTDPSQGASLSIAILEALHRMQATVVVTTHYNEVKEFIAQQSYAENAAMSFDFATLKPTYHIRYGSYGQSYAFDIAQSLDLPKNIIEEAKRINKNHENVATDLLAIYEEKLQELEVLTETTNAKTQELATRETYLEKQEQAIDSKLLNEKQKLQKQFEEKFSKNTKKVQEMLNELKDKKNLKQNEFSDIQGSLNALIDDKIQANSTIRKTIDKFQIGDTVQIDALGTKGEIVAKKKNDVWVVKSGILSTNARSKELTLLKKSTNSKKSQVSPPVGRVKMNYVSSSLDLRGVRVADGLEMLDQYLANAKSSHDVVSIIHGHGTGQMRDAVQKFLKNRNDIKSFRFGGEGEGGVGATIVEFK